MLIKGLVLANNFELQHKLLSRLYVLKHSRTHHSTNSRRFVNVSKTQNSNLLLLNNWNKIKYLNKRFNTKDSKSLDGKVVLTQSASGNTVTPTASPLTSPTSDTKSSQSSLSAAINVLPSNIKIEELPKYPETSNNLNSSNISSNETITNDDSESIVASKEIKKYEISTPSGLLTITTTIEDSKINEVVLEKSNPDALIGKTKIVADGGNIISTISSVKGNQLAKSIQKMSNDYDDDITTNTATKQKNLNDLTKETVAKKIKKEPASVNPSKLLPLKGPKTKITAKSINEAVNAEESVSAAATAATGSSDSKKDIENDDNDKKTDKDKKINSDGSGGTKSTDPTEQSPSRVAAAAAAAVSQASAVPIAPVPDAKPKKRTRVDFNRSSLERNFITPNRAISDFLLKPSDLDSLPKIKRRSPYEQEPPITVYWRKDVEAKAIEVWGSKENLIKETLKREVDRKKHQQNLFTVKRRLREYRREIGYRTKPLDDEALGLEGKSGRVVVIAIGINGLNFIFKVGAWLLSGSHSMFAEAIHSLADTTNQAILAYGIHKSVQMADPDHPYGYSNMRHVSSLISGVGIFCVGCGLSIYHGITGLLNPDPLLELFWPFCILGGALVSEGATLMVALNKLKRSAKKEGVSTKEYILSGKDPCVNVVLTEDAAAVTSVVVAAGCMGLSSITGNPVYDAVGSLLVGAILGSVASFIIYTNSSALVGKSISEELLEKINSELESDCMIRAIYDVKGIHMGNSLIRYKAELDFDGRELSRYYLEKQDMSELFKLVKSFQSPDELEQFLLTHGENIVDLMGGEIDRIELKLRSKFPEIRHCDLEVL